MRVLFTFPRLTIWTKMNCIDRKYSKVSFAPRGNREQEKNGGRLILFRKALALRLRLFNLKVNLSETVEVNPHASESLDQNLKPFPSEGHRKLRWTNRYSGMFSALGIAFHSSFDHWSFRCFHLEPPISKTKEEIVLTDKIYIVAHNHNREWPLFLELSNMSWIRRVQVDCNFSYGMHSRTVIVLRLTCSLNIRVNCFFIQRYRFHALRINFLLLSYRSQPADSRN